MKYININNIYLSLLICFYASQLHAQVISPYITQVEYNTNVYYINSEPLSVFPNHVMVDTIGTVNSTNTPTIIVNLKDAKIDGYHRDTIGRRYFSFDTDLIFNGVSVLKSDIIRCSNSDCTTHFLFFDSLAESLNYLNIDAFTLDPENGDLIFSVSSYGLINGASIYPSDLFRYNSNGNFTLEFNTLGTLGSNRNIDAVSLLPNGYYLISLSDDGNYNNEFNYNDADILQFYPPNNSWSIAYTPLSWGNSFNQVDITSLMGFENDLIFKDGFD